jgi:prepilin-type N-terminal cleavage/methylation domain-containing protein
MRHFVFSFPTPLARQRAFSLVELLVVLGISCMLILPFVAVSMGLQRSYTANHAKMDALANARGAMEMLCNDLKNIYYSNPATQESDMVGSEPSTMEYGDRFDNNGNGKVDEEIPDGGASTTTTFVDRHGAIGSYYERWHGLTLADVGDVGVEDDTRFTSSSLLFYINYPDAQDGYAKVTYQVATGLAANASVGWKGDSDTRSLIRQLDYVDKTTGKTQSLQEPVAFDVLSFHTLFWDADHSDVHEKWLTSWPKTSLPGSTPSTVYLEVTVYADSKPIRSYQPGTTGPGIQTITLRTAVNIEAVLSTMKRGNQNQLEGN